MMVNRIAMNADGVVVSVPGKDALSPSLNPDDKIFDSNWAFSSFILHEGWFNKLSVPLSQSSTTILFPDVGAVPYVQLLSTKEYEGGFYGPAGSFVMQSGHRSQLPDTGSFGETYSNVQRSKVERLVVLSDRFSIHWRQFNVNDFRKESFSWYVWALSN